MKAVTYSLEKGADSSLWF